MFDGGGHDLLPPVDLIAQLSASVAPLVKTTRPPGGNNAATLVPRHLHRRLRLAAGGMRRMRVRVAVA